MKLQLIIFVFLISFVGIAQVGIGTTSPDGSAALDVTATDKGFLMPRMTTVQKDAITNPATGLQVYDLDTKSVWTYDGSAWKESSGGGKFVDGATPDIAYYEGKVGIGRNAFANHKLWVEGNTEGSGTITTAKVVTNYNGTGGTNATYGIAGEVYNNNSGTITYAAGTLGGVINKAGGTLKNGYGSWNYITNNGTVEAGYGVLGSFYNQAGTATYGEAGFFSIENSAGATISAATLGDFYATNYGTITDLYGVYMQYAPASTGTVTNSYGLYIDYNFNKGTGLNYALYSVPDIDSYIEGNVGFGISEPKRKVHINGVMRLEPLNSAPSNPEIGDMYVDTSGILHFYGRTSSSTFGWNIVSLIAE